MTNPPSEMSPLGQTHPVIKGVFNALVVLLLADNAAAGMHLATDSSGAGVLEFLTTFGVIILLSVSTVLVSIYRGTPWPALFPAFLVYSWASFLFIPLPLVWGLESLPLIGFTLQSAALLFCIHRIRSAFGSRLFFPDAAFYGCRFSWTYSLKAHALIGASVVLLSGGLAAACIFSLEYLSGGFLRIRPSGLYTEARVYTLENTQLHLLPSVHIATPSFYQRLIKRLPEAESVIIPEGVTDRTGILKHGIDHSVTAKAVGLTPQPSLTEIRKTAIHPCDADVSEFSPQTQGVLRAIGDCVHALSTHDNAEAIRAFSNPNLLNMNGMHETLIADILEKRNQRVVAAIEATRTRYKYIGVPWGAAHMAGIEKELLAKGATKKSSDLVQVFAWKDLRFTRP